MRLTFLLGLLLAMPAWAGPAGSIQDAIADGRCRDAASRIESEAPPQDDPQLWRLLGDARRCLGEARPAAVAYRRHLEAVGGDPAVLDLLVGLREQLATLRIRVDSEGEAQRVVGLLLDGSEEVATREADGRWYLRDLEPGSPLTLHVTGRGMQDLELRMVAPAVAAVRDLDVRPTWLGLAKALISPAAPADVAVTLESRGESVRLGGSPSRPLGAGDATARLKSPRGEVAVPLTLRAGQELKFDPTPWIPTRLTVSDVPAGATLRLFFEGVEPPLERVVEVPDVGEIDGSTGVRLAGRVVVDGAVGGAVTLVLTHAALGVVASELVLTRGADNVAEVDWRGSPEARGIQEEWHRWKAKDDELRRASRVPLVAGAVAAGVGVALSAIGFGVASSSQDSLDQARDNALAGLPHSDDPNGWFGVHQATLLEQRGAMSAAIGGLVVGTAGGAIVGVFGSRAQVKSRERGAWSPP